VRSSFRPPVSRRDDWPCLTRSRCSLRRLCSLSSPPCCSHACAGSARRRAGRRSVAPCQRARRFNRALRPRLDLVCIHHTRLDYHDASISSWTRLDDRTRPIMVPPTYALALFALLPALASANDMHDPRYVARLRARHPQVSAAVLQRRAPASSTTTARARATRVPKVATTAEAPVPAAGNAAVSPLFLLSSSP
jgi:hypothetical protein